MLNDVWLILTYFQSIFIKLGFKFKSPNIYWAIFFCKTIHWFPVIQINARQAGGLSEYHMSWKDVSNHQNICIWSSNAKYSYRLFSLCPWLHQDKFYLLSLDEGKRTLRLQMHQILFHSYPKHSLSSQLKKRKDRVFEFITIGILLFPVQFFTIVVNKLIHNWFSIHSIHTINCELTTS